MILLFSIFPGVLGLAARKIFYPTLFKKVGKGVVFGRNMVIRHPHKIVIGNHVIIDDDTLIDAKGEENEGIVIGDYVTIGRFSSLVCKNANSIEWQENIGIDVLVHGEFERNDMVEYFGEQLEGFVFTRWWRRTATSSMPRFRCSPCRCPAYCIE